MPDANYHIELPNISNALDQHEEFFTLDRNGQREEIRFHDYERIFAVPGLYEALFHERLRCNSPAVMADLLCSEAQKADTEPAELRVLDFGAGGGMVAEALQQRGVDFIVGADILPEAKMAAERDRPQVYEDYLVADLTQPSASLQDTLASYGFNAMVTVAALGFDDVPPAALVNGFNFVADEGWFAFNIRDKFLHGADVSGYREVISWLSDDHFAVQRRHSYTHRLSVSGEPLEYTAFVGRKRKNAEGASVVQTKSNANPIDQKAR